MNLLSLRLLDGPERCVGAERCLERDLKSSRSHLTSKMVIRENYWELHLTGGVRAHLIVRYEGHT